MPSRVGAKDVLVHKKKRLTMRERRVDPESGRIAGINFSFVFVRHPFLRLTSTFQNKVVDGDESSLWIKWILEERKRVAKEGRDHGPTQRVENPPPPTFREFVKVLSKDNCYVTRRITAKFFLSL